MSSTSDDSSLGLASEKGATPTRKCRIARARGSGRATQASGSDALLGIDGRVSNPAPPLLVLHCRRDDGWGMDAATPRSAPADRAVPLPPMRRRGAPDGSKALAEHQHNGRGRTEVLT